jgi:hypothetical protein
MYCKFIFKKLNATWLMAQHNGLGVDDHTITSYEIQSIYAVDNVNKLR